MKKAIAPILLIALPACESLFGEEQCHTAIYDAVHVLVTDSVTGEPAAFGVDGWISMEGYEERLVTVPDSLANDFTRQLLVALGDGPGRYEVTISKVGYETWSGSADVGWDGCSVETETLTARLQPS